MSPLTDYDLPALERDLVASGFPASHGRRILRAFYDADGSAAFDRARLGNRLCDQLDALPGSRTRLLHRVVSADETTKLLLGLPDGAAVECVLMPARRDGRAMGCVSSQVGCAMGCDFCASTKRGLERNLLAGEIVEQFLHLRREAKSRSRKLTSLVFMGMGEPMHNLDEVLPAVRRIADPDRGGLGWRQVTVSTVGIIPGIERLAAADLNVHLALSLHAPDDATRASIVPMNRRFTVAEIVAAARAFYERTGRIVTIEYCLLDGVNDSDDHARMLIDLLATDRFHVNLIPFNPIGPGPSGKIYRRPSRERLARFLDLLRAGGLVTHCRDTRGDDVNAACGQLRETMVALG